MTNAKYAREFFEDKRPWSRIKDRILGSYIPAYTAKIARRGHHILFIDAFAGPGKFDQTNAPGSPLIICSNAEKLAKGDYSGIFINKDKAHHEQLEGILKKGGYTPQARAVLSDSNKWLTDLAPVLSQPYSVFLYMDPYGLTVPFETIERFLNRPRNYSTEIIINLCTPVLHRLASRNTTLLEEGTLEQRHNKLTSILGGDYWKEALLTEGLSTKEREERVVKGYVAKLSENGYLQYTGYCPIQATRDSTTKYYMIFASPHPDAMILMNDNMLRAFEDFMTEKENEDTLFANLSWKDWRDARGIEQITLEYIHRYKGFTRGKIWEYILRDHFFRFTSGEYKKVTTDLFRRGLISTPNRVSSPTARLNDECLLYPSDM